MFHNCTCQNIIRLSHYDATWRKFFRNWWTLPHSRVSTFFCWKLYFNLVKKLIFFQWHTLYVPELLQEFKFLHNWTTVVAESRLWSPFVMMKLLDILRSFDGVRLFSLNNSNKKINKYGTSIWVDVYLTLAIP